jgi:manganese transport protein
MVLDQASAFFSTEGNMIWKIIILLCGVGYLVLLIYAIVYPLRKREKKEAALKIHTDPVALESLSIPAYARIAIALDFSEKDHKLISHAIGQGNKDTTYILIHIVESAATRLMGKETDDLETRKDKEHLEKYVQQLNERGIKAIPMMGFNDRTKEIVKLVKQSNAEMLVIGAHGHSGIKDLLFGQTIEAVRHELKITVLVVPR